MVERVTFPADVTGSEPPAAEAAPLTGDAKALADTKAELTRVQQELAALKKAPASEAPPADPNAAPPAADPNAPPAADPNAAPKADDPNAAADVVKAAGLDVAPWQQEFDTTGDVSEESRAKIAEGLKGVLGEGARAVVDQFIDGQKAARAQETAVYYDAAGGTENYAKIADWAKASLTPAELTAYNNILQTGDKDAALVAIKGLRARYESVNGREPRLVNAGVPGAADQSVFRSKAEMVAAMSDPRYKTDPAYRKEVEAKTGRSPY